MKTRIIKTKFWEDEKILTLKPETRGFYQYLLTNQKINIVGVYELAEVFMSFQTGYPGPQIQEMKAELVAAGRAGFCGTWVIIPNAMKHGNYAAVPSNYRTTKEEIDSIPTEVKKFIELSFPDLYTNLYSTVYTTVSVVLPVHRNINNKIEKERGSGGEPNYRSGGEDWPREPAKPSYDIFYHAKDYSDLRGEDREYMDNACYMGDRRLAPAGPPKGTPEKLVLEWRKVYARKYGTEVQPSNPAHAGN